MRQAGRALAGRPSSTGSRAPARKPGRAWQPLLALASGLYGASAWLHRRIARTLAPLRGRPACVVVSVGGLTVGGAGKTPTAAALALGLRQRGLRVALASRGYGGSVRQRVQLVSDGARIHSNVALSGDESLVLAAHAPGVPVLVGRDRRLVGHHAVALFDAQVLILDDGFQHHRLVRDLDIVCIDGQAGLGNGRVLPWGPLREPASALRDADWLCVVDPVAGQPLPRSLAEDVAAGRPLLRARRRARFLAPLDPRLTDRAGRRSDPASLAQLAGQAVGLLAGVARPASVRRTLESLGAHVVAERLFPDHHVYRPRDLADLDEGVSGWITTEKDALKILPEWLPEGRLSVLGIDVELEQPADFLDPIEALVQARQASSGGERRIRPAPSTTKRARSR